MPTECQGSQAGGREWKVREGFLEEVISKPSSVIQWTWDLVGFSDLLLSMYTFTLQSLPSEKERSIDCKTHSIHDRRLT